MARSPAPRRSPLTPFYVILGVVALAGIGVLLYQVLGAEEAATRPVEVAISPEELSRVPGIAVGREDAPVVIYEFADFQCPACASYAWQVLPLVKERLVETGKVRLVFYDFPLAQHPYAFLAARAARCANEQGKFWEFHDAVYARQVNWSRAGDAGEATDFFIDLAGELGLDRGEFRACLRSDRYAKEVTENLKLGESLGVGGTPTIFVNSKRLPNPPGIRELEEIVERETGGAPAGDTAQSASTVDTSASR